MVYTYIEYKIEENIAHIILNRPDVLNALNRPMVSEIYDAVDKIRKNTEIRALIISGKEKNFAAGADIAPMVDLDPDGAREFCFNKPYNAIEDLPIPVIAAISGFALGGGMELALACDFRICSQNAKMGFPEIKIGIFPGAGGTQRLPRLIGISRAKDMIFSGQIIDAGTALQYGLCDRVTADDPIDEAVKMARVFAARPALTLSRVKEVINRGLDKDLRSGIAYEEEMWVSLFSTGDQKEGMKAFLEKRKPNFKGK